MSINLLSDRTTVVDSLAAELTSAAYPVLLRGGMSGSWVELELGLWKALAETVAPTTCSWRGMTLATTRFKQSDPDALAALIQLRKVPRGQETYEPSLE